MREIKFRAWWLDNCAMLENGEYQAKWRLSFVHSIHIGKNSIIVTGGICNSARSVCIGDECIIDQFTGLYDKNNKEIFEGDILHGREEGDGETTAWADVYFQIVYNEKLASFMAHEIGQRVSSWEEQVCELNTEYEVVGNIHENPDLLKC